MNREKQLETIIIDLSIMLVSVLIIVWDFLPRTLLGNILKDTERKLDLIDEDKLRTRTVRDDIEKIRKHINREGK